MKFNVVLGNPPYNNDIYLDFVQLGFKLSSDYTLMITPAKWQAKGGVKNENFRKMIVPHMSKIVYYPDCKDVFDIGEWGGLSYYLVDKANNERKRLIIKTVNNRNNNINSEFQEHDEDSECVNLYNRNILNIVGKVGQLGEGFKQSLYVKNTDHGESSIAGQLGFKRQTFVGEQDRGYQKITDNYVEVLQGENICGYKKKSELFTQYNLDKWKCITSIIVSGQSRYADDGTTQRYINIYSVKPNQVPKGSFPVLHYFDTEDEAKSFISYFDTSLIKFLFNLGICGTTLTKEFFRFIPDPGPFNKIFEDKPLPGYTPNENGEYTDNSGQVHCSLYVKYKLTEEEINIIESVIKERKTKQVQNTNTSSVHPNEK